MAPRGRNPPTKAAWGVNIEFPGRHLDLDVRLAPLTCRTLPQVRRQERLSLQSQSPKKKQIPRPQLKQETSWWPQKRCKTRQDHPTSHLSPPNRTGHRRRHPLADAPLLPLPSTKDLYSLQPWHTSAYTCSARLNARTCTPFSPARLPACPPAFRTRMAARTRACAHGLHRHSSSTDC